MKINMKITGEFKNDEQELRDYVRDKSRAFLKSSKKQIKEIGVNIFNADDPYAHRDKECSIYLSIPGQYPIKVTKHDVNIFTAITSAIETAAHKTSLRTRQRATLFNN